MANFNKITEELYYDEKFNLYDNIAENVSSYIDWTVCDFEEALKESVINCESPIEQLLAISFERIELANMVSYNPFIDVLKIENQGEIESDEHTYRVDFLIPVYYKNQGLKLYAIECDGHDFHQKTKEQVRRDNERQRNLQKVGCEVIRFSGSEIFKSSYKCATEVKRIILSNCKYIKNKED